MLIQLALSLPAHAATLNVCTSCTYTTVSAAVNAAAAGDTVQIDAGTFSVPANVMVSRAVTIVGAGKGATILQQQGGDRMFQLNTSSAVTLQGFTARGGGPTPRGAIDVSNQLGPLVIRDIEATGFGYGGSSAILLMPGASGGVPVTIDGVDIHDNAGSALYFRGVLRPPTSGVPAPQYAQVLNSTFTRNSSVSTGREGGAAYVENSAVRFFNSTFVENSSTKGGALAVKNDPAAILVEDCVFTDNYATMVGGAVNAPGGGAQRTYVEVRRSRFEDNRAPDGGVYEQSGAQVAVFYDNTFTRNRATGTRGGAIYVQGSSSRITVRRSLFCDNDAVQYGGAVALEAYGTIASNYQFSNNRYLYNTAGQFGGAFNAYQGAYDSRNELFLDNGSGAVRWSGSTSGSVLRNAIVGLSPSYGLNTQVSGTVRYGDWFLNAPGNVTGPIGLDGTNRYDYPDFFAFSDDGNCDNDDLRIAQSSALVNAGDPAISDPDGSRSDLSPWGGPDANPAWWTDGDGDGTRWVYDCDDKDAAVSGAQTWLFDGDSDAYGDPANGTSACIVPQGYVSSSKIDCDDAAASVHPNAPEICNAKDDDCDGLVDEGGLTRFYRDADGDAKGDSGVFLDTCSPPSGYVVDATDCNDGDASIRPGVAETCDGTDRNCDGDPTKNAIDAKTYFRDADTDGYSVNGASPQTVCVPPSGYSAITGDCDDASPLVFPGAAEQCNGVDDDCDGATDEGVTNVDWFVDFDGDGFGEDGAPINDCAAPAGRVANNQDCDDSDPSARPGASEVCNAKDDDCDGLIDDAAANALTWYRDQDTDGYGVSSSTTTACAVPTGFAGSAGDCNDSDAATHPGAPEDCAAADRDCDGQPANLAVDQKAYWEDADADGFGDPTSESFGCTAPAGFVPGPSADCDDADDTVNPSAVDACGDAVDSDCEGTGGPLDDEDLDGITNEIEFVYGSDGCAQDSDNDGITDVDEWGPDLSGNPENHDGDSLADVADPDDDDDGIATVTEGIADEDGDGTGNWLDGDSDADGFLDVEEGTGDEDGDGTPNYLDPASIDTDTDGDGLSDVFESANGLAPFNADSDGDGLRDGLEADEATGTWDTDQDGSIDALDDDDDGDGVPTADEDLDGDGDWTNDDEDADGTASWLDPDEPVRDTGCDPCDTGDTDTADTDTSQDTDTAVDSDSDTDTGNPPSAVPKVVCGCQSVGRPSAGGYDKAAWVLALVLVPLWRRRRG